MAYNLGDTVRLSFEVRDADGGLVAPGGGAPTLTITLPDGTTATPSVTSPSPGQYSATYVTTVFGRHLYRWLATGTDACAEVDIIDVRPVDRAWLISLKDARNVLNLRDHTDDNEVRDWLGATTLVVEHHTGRAWVQHTRTDTVDGGRYAIALPVSPVQSVTSLVPLLDIGATSYTGAEIRANTHGILRLADGAPFDTGEYQATYVVGPANTVPVPENVIGAVKIILPHLWETQRGSRLPTGDDGEFDFDPRAGYALPNRAKELLGDGIPGIA